MFDEHEKRTIQGWAALFLVATVWALIAWLVPPLGYAAAITCLVCALFDMGMNGAADAEFAPFNLAGAALAGGGAWLGTLT